MRSTICQLNQQIMHAVFLLFVIIATPQICAAASNVDITKSEYQQLMPEHFQYWVESSQPTLEQIISLPDIVWSNISNSAIAVNERNKPVWFKVNLENSQNEAIDRLFEIRWSNLSSVDYYVLDSSHQLIAQGQLGLEADTDEIKKLGASWLIPLHVAAFEKNEIYLRVHSQFSTFLPSYIWEPDAFNYHQQLRFIVFSAAFGILIGLLLYNLSIYFVVRDKSYLFYSAFLFLATLYELSFTGLGYYFIWSDEPWLRQNIYTQSAILTFLSAAFFMRKFLNLKEVGGWLLQANTITLSGWSLLLVTHTVFKNLSSSGIIELSVLVSCAATLAISIKLWHQGSLNAFYFSIAWSTLLLMTIATNLSLQGLLPYSSVIENGQLIGLVIGALILSFSLADLINREKEKSHNANKMAEELKKLAAAQRDEKLQTQADMLKLQDITTQKVEDRVAERTHELERTLTNLEIANEELAKLSITDTLTQIYNRRYFNEILSREVARSNRTGRPTSLLLVDIDHFKSFNDTYGHLVGDDCLRLVASTLQKLINRRTDLLARYGGEEFAIILADCNIENSAKLAEQVRSTIEAVDFIYKQQRLPLTVSIGLSMTLSNGKDTTSALIKQADEALYSAKSSGRNCIRFAQREESPSASNDAIVNYS